MNNFSIHRRTLLKGAAASVAFAALQASGMVFLIPQKSFV